MNQDSKGETGPVPMEDMDIDLEFMKDYQPDFIRFAPPLYFARDELVWIAPLDPRSHEVILDGSMGREDGDEATEARQLLTLALEEALSISQRQTLIAEMARDPRLVQILVQSLSPEKLPKLVENNPLIAVDVLLRFNELPELCGFLNQILNMEMSIHSMEVVNRLTASVELPKEFLHLYISNCIATCEGIKDKYVQNRLIRLICVFLQSLIRNRIINIQVQELYIEIMTFCVEFSRIREAASLYRLMKQLEADFDIPKKIEDSSIPTK